MKEGKQNLNEGKTESTKAVQKPATISKSEIITHGETESPQAVLRPTKPSGDSHSGSKNSK